MCNIKQGKIKIGFPKLQLTAFYLFIEKKVQQTPNTIHEMAIHCGDNLCLYSKKVLAKKTSK